VDRVLLILYHYVPSRPAAVAAVVLYAVISILVTGISIKTRSYFMLTVAVTGFLELAGKEIWVTRPLGSPVGLLRAAASSALRLCCAMQLRQRLWDACGPELVPCHGRWQLDTASPRLHQLRTVPLS
jgi:hypothetical protein